MRAFKLLLLLNSISWRHAPLDGKRIDGTKSPPMKPFDNVCKGSDGIQRSQCAEWEHEFV